MRAGAERGNERALDALRRAAEELDLGFQAATGRPVSTVERAFEGLTETGLALSQPDPHFAYTATTHPTGGPTPGVPPGTVVSLSRSKGGRTDRVDAVPANQQALERYGPVLALTRGEGAAGQDAMRTLERALRRGEAVTIGAGVDVVFERLPPAFEDMVGRRVSGEITLKPHHPPPPVPDWDAQLEAGPADARSRVRVRLRPSSVECPLDWDHEFTGTYGGMRVVARTRWRGRGAINLSFTHTRDQSPVRKQLAALQFVEAAATSGRALMRDLGPSKRSDVPFSFAPFDVPVSAQVLLAFFRDIRAIEERAGVEFELPDEISRDEASHVASLAATIRDGGRPITWTDATFVVEEAAVEKIERGKPLRIEQEASAVLMGRQLDLGTVVKELQDFEVTSSSPAPGQAGMTALTVIPSDEGAASLFERLLPVAKAPPPPPKKAASRRRRSKPKRRNGG